MTRNIIPNSLEHSQRKDFQWMIMLHADTSNTVPMWVGWNAMCLNSSEDGMQKIWYLPQINLSPTSNSVIIETMKRSQQLAEECHMGSIAVTYDLAIAKVAMQIQAHEAPRFNNIFVAMGAFHMEMPFFNAIGKYIEESGGPYILIDSGVLASGSLRGFIKSKSYNRCKRLHGLLSVAL